MQRANDTFGLKTALPALCARLLQGKFGLVLRRP